MAQVRETKLPGVGVRHDFTAATGAEIGVIVHHDGRREILLYDHDDADASSSVIQLSPLDARTMSEVLGASQVTEVVEAVQQHIEGLAIEWITVPANSLAITTSIGGARYRSKTGASIVAVIRDHQSIPAPGADFRMAVDDVIVAVGTVEGVAALRQIIRPN